VMAVDAGQLELRALPNVGSDLINSSPQEAEGRVRDSGRNWLPDSSSVVSNLMRYGTP